jgi:hypothetical protein
MIVVAIDSVGGRCELRVEGEPQGPVIVRASADLCLTQLDSVLRRDGVGCAPGHHAEFGITGLIEWLGTNGLVKADSDRFAHWLDGPVAADFIDDGGEWLAAQISWEDTRRHALDEPLTVSS